MSVERFQVVLKLTSLDEDDRVWFGRWLRRYAVFLRQPENVALQVSQNSVKQFCRTLLAREVPAWQRLQAVRAIEFLRRICWRMAMIFARCRNCAFMSM